ncbi:MAG: exodeoxyribonuclease VII small subunit [Dysgonamonadaceae bacterium]|jgi:exodeoxyribonuclease VII small subunit|nr:exodeoxyribonuclease VII small subunit [Dysgonamonadaceae bacterium]
MNEGAKKTNYTKAYNRLQEILQLIENDKLDVDELSEKIKEATSLLKTCKEKLFIADEEVRKALEELK